MPKSTKLAAQKEAEEAAEDLAAFEDADSAFVSPIHEITYIDPGWKAGSFWTFRAQISDEDETEIEGLTQHVVIKGVTNSQIAQWQRDGLNVQAKILEHAETEQVETGRRAMLSQMTVAWGGPRFTLPRTFALVKDEEGKPVIHELAGQVPPCTPEWIRRLGLKVAETAYWHMYPFWSGLRGPEDQEYFRPELSDVVKPSSDTAAAAEIPVPAAAV